MSRDRLIYLTYGDMDSPVFETQVVEFCDFISEEVGIEVQIVSFVPMRLYSAQKKKLERYNRNILVYPVVNRLQGKRWYSRYNGRLIEKLGAASVMCRNPIAAHVVEYLKETGMRSFYDARGCQYIEMKEFSDASPEAIAEMQACEVLSFRNADWVYAVSNALVEYFKDNHRYRDHTFSVVPCCYNSSIKIDSDQRSLKQTVTGDRNGNIFCYAGSLGVWNFPNSFISLLKAILKDKENSIVILSHEINRLDGFRFLQNNPQVILKSVGVKQVKEYLSISDYSILLRKNALTNSMASPSKFAEYLASGSQVIISPGIGDLSSFVEEQKCGVRYRNKKDNKVIATLPRVTAEQREKNKVLAQQYFQRKSEFNKIKYRNLKKVHLGEYND